MAKSRRKTKEELLQAYVELLREREHSKWLTSDVLYRLAQDDPFTPPFEGKDDVLIYINKLFKSLKAHVGRLDPDEREGAIAKFRAEARKAADEKREEEARPNKERDEGRDLPAPEPICGPDVAAVGWIPYYPSL